jgi:hypothetical protein
MNHVLRLLWNAPFRCGYLLLHKSVPAYGQDEK